MIVKLRDRVAVVADAVCGVRKTLRMSRIGESSGIGSGSKTSRAATIRPSRSLAMSASVWTIAPRETLTKTDAVAHQVELARRRACPRVAGVIGARQTTTSDSESTLSSDVNVMSYTSASSRGTYGSYT